MTTAEKLNFDEQVAVVTGGGRGIGRTVCESFAGLGADVGIADVDVSVAEETGEEIEEEHGVETVAVETDVTSHDDAVNMVETVTEKLGPIDVLVNNAGIWDVEEFVDTTPEQWEREIGVCFTGTLNCTHAVLPQMIERGTGSVVNFASDSYKGNDPNIAVYAAAKGANVSFTKAVSKEVGKEGVRVNCVSPGMTETRQTEEKIEKYGDRIAEKAYALDRLGRPEDIADGVVFLASDAADWITGESLSVNGGYTKG